MIFPIIDIILNAMTIVQIVLKINDYNKIKQNIEALEN